MDYTTKTLPVLDLSGGMNTAFSDFLIKDSESTLLVNLYTDNNKLSVIKWFTEYLDIGGEINWWEFDGDIMAVISGRDLHIIDTETNETIVVKDAVGLGIDWFTTSSNESYNIHMYKGYIIITNSLKDKNSKLYSQWEPPNIFYKDGTRQVYKNLLNNFTPTSAFAHDGILYLAGGTQNSWYRNWVIIWQAEWTTGDILTDVPMMFDFSTCDTDIWFAGDTTEVTAIMENLWQLFISKKSGILPLSTQDTTEAWLQVVTGRKLTSSGVLSQSAWVNVNDTVFFYDWVSVRILSNELQNTITDQNVSKQIQNELDCMPRDQRYATMTFEYPLVKLFLSQYGGANDTAFLYNVETQGWSIQRWINTNYTLSGYSYKNARMDSFFAWIDGKIYRDNDGTSYNWEYIDFEWISKGIAFWDIFQSKEISDIRVYGGHNWEVALEWQIISEYEDNSNVFTSATDMTKRGLWLESLQTTGNSTIGKNTVWNFSPTLCWYEKKYIFKLCNERVVWHKH